MFVSLLVEFTDSVAIRGERVLGNYIVQTRLRNMSYSRVILAVSGYNQGPPRDTVNGLHLVPYFRSSSLCRWENLPSGQGPAAGGVKTVLAVP